MINSWSPSRLFEYEECPQKAKYKAEKLCPNCFKGKVFGGFDGAPALCDTCEDVIQTPEPIERGNRLDESIEQHLKTGSKLAKEIKHPKVLRLIAELRALPGKVVQAQEQITLDKTWRAISKFTKGAWFRGKLDVLRLLPKGVAQVLDWKSGGIDKKTGGIRPSGKYQDQLEIYNAAVLSANPLVEAVSASLVFLDVGPRFDPIVAGPTLYRAKLPAAQAKWTKRALPMLSDKVFAPRPGYYCGFCDFSKGKGGPCKF
jgi:hypothetical protein